MAGRALRESARMHELHDDDGPLTSYLFRNAAPGILLQAVDHAGLPFVCLARVGIRVCPLGDDDTEAAPGEVAVVASHARRRDPFDAGTDTRHGRKHDAIG